MSPVRRTLDASVPGATVRVGGQLAVMHDEMMTSQSDLVRGELISIPILLVALILVFVLSDALHLIPRGILVIIIAFSLTRWMDVARLVRGQSLALREREFVEAARMSGARDFGLVFRHIFPNALGPIIVQATFAIPAAVLFEAFLSFLGLGLPSPTPSWGAMAADGYHGMDFAPHIVLAPTIALSLTLMAFNWVGDGLRDAFDPRMRR